MIKHSIYYMSTTPEEREWAKKLQQELTTRAQYKGIQCASLPQKELVDAPEEVLLLAHSDESRTVLDEYTPNDVAKRFATIYKKNKLRLKSIKLISCEAGVGTNPLALQLVKALKIHGFIDVTVHTATHPKESLGGTMAIITKGRYGIYKNSFVGQTAAIMYGNQETSDYFQHEELKNKKGKPQSYSLIQLLYDIEELELDYNTYTAEGRKKELSFDVAVALDVLKTNIALLHQYPELKKIITFLNRNSDATQKEIDAFFIENNTYIMNRFKKKIQQKIEEKRLALYSLSLPDDDYLENLLLGKSSLLKRIFYWLDIPQTKKLAKYLSQQIHWIKKEERALFNEFNTLKEDNRNRPSTPIKNTNISSIFYGPQKIDTHFFDNYFQEKKPCKERYKEIEKRYDALSNQKKEHYTAMMQQLKKIHNRLDKIQAKKASINTQINTFIDNYLAQHATDNDVVHQDKKAVMSSIKKYINTPTTNNWHLLLNKIEKHKLWNQGFFSKVNSTMEQVKEFHDELEKEAQNTFSK